MAVQDSATVFEKCVIWRNIAASEGWNRYRGMGVDMVKKMDELGITSLAQYYTSDMKYAPQAFERDSLKLRSLLEAKGFLP